MGHRISVSLVVLVALVLLAGGVAAAQSAVSAADGWVKLPAAGETTAMAGVTVKNPTMYDVYVVGVSSDVAGEIEIRDRAPGASAATAVKEIAVPAFGALEMQAESAHLVLKNLKRPLEAGSTITLSLTTDGGAVLTTIADVRSQ